ncbi:MAG: helix-turn-helix domain-containing protein, partial [Bacteroidales bacterium]|nr:helix-turn-helix domain-containing protein [Bacteroidales bacterium]
MPKIRKAYKVRLKTNVEIETKLSQFCGSARF